MSSCCTTPAPRRVAGATLAVCLAGNPNVGKSTLFNKLTGSAIETANYPGMTVSLNIAAAQWEGHTVEVVDLPGTYALGAVSDDQYVARRGLLDTSPDVVVAVVDATNLARNLYIVLQLLDLGYRVVVALNLVDEARRRGLDIDSQALAAELGVPVVRTVATRGEGLDGLAKIALAVAMSTNGVGRGRRRRYGEQVEQRVAMVVRGLAERQGGGAAAALPFGLSPRSLALSLVEGDAELGELSPPNATPGHEPSPRRRASGMRLPAPTAGGGSLLPL
jgi:ferrous iron transport protein B